jgi:hypothetical protein
MSSLRDWHAYRRKNACPFRPGQTPFLTERSTCRANLAQRCTEGRYRHARDQWLRAAQSIPVNIAESSTEYDVDVD